jgi:hypothetical protein
LIAGKKTVASVNGEPITLEEFRAESGSIQEGGADNSIPSRSNPGELLDRIIGARLIVQEARNIGLDELPEVKSSIDGFEKETLQNVLFGIRAGKIRKADKKAVERLYRDSIKEVELVAVFLEKEEEARKLEEEVKAGGVFEALVKQSIDSGEGRGGSKSEYHKFKLLTPEVAGAVAAMKKGQISPLIKIGKNHAMVKLLAVRFPENPDARKEAEMEALQEARIKSINAFVEDLKKKYVRVDEKLLEDLDYDSPEPGIDALRKDERILAKIKGEDPVTVAELSTALFRKFFHGTDKAAEKKRINRMKHGALEGILVKRVAIKEAKRTGVLQNRMYRNRVEEHRRDILFGTFFQRAIDPEIKMDEADLKAYMREHIGEFTSREEMRIESMAFSGKAYAEDAIEKLRKGSDFQWIRSNAEGRIDPGKDNNTLPFGDKPIATKELPEDIRKDVSGAGSGSYRLYSASGGIHYVLHIREVIPPAPLPFESVKSMIAKTVYAEKRKKAFEAYLEKLRGASDIKVFAAGKALEQALRGSR